MALNFADILAELVLLNRINLLNQDGNRKGYKLQKFIWQNGINRMIIIIPFALDMVYQKYSIKNS